MNAARALDILNAERARQRGDAVLSFAAALPRARAIAEAIRASARLVLVGMGGSYYINRVVEPLYRAAGIDAGAHTASGLLELPLPPGPRVTILVSQSGGSSEIRAYLDRPAREETRFGLTLEGGSVLARAVPCLVGEGGSERSFAAARSILVTLALHAAILEALGAPQREGMAWLEGSRDVETAALSARLASASSFIVVAPAALRGVAESAGLTLMELSRLPVLALEYGQFRHGPAEALTDATGIILLRGSGSAPAAEIAVLARRAQSPIVALDLGEPGDTAIESRALVPLGPGIAGPAAALLACQALAIDLAAARVPDVGEPRLLSKVM